MKSSSEAGSRPGKKGKRREEKGRKNKPSPRGRWKEALRKGVLGLLLALLFLPPVQVLALRGFDPLATPLRGLRRLEAGLGGRWLTVRRESRPLSGFSPAIRKAVVAAEDDHFFTHQGFDWDSIRDSVEDHQEKGKELRGASTLTQQCARTLFLWPHRSWIRKGLEAWYTVWMEALLSKDRILELYLNHVEWGDGVFGAEAASTRVFGHGADSLNAEEAALLAAILPAPRTWSAASPSRKVKRRQALILRRMGAMADLENEKSPAKKKTEEPGDLPPAPVSSPSKPEGTPPAPLGPEPDPAVASESVPMEIDGSPTETPPPPSGEGGQNP